MGDLTKNFSRWEFACPCGCGQDTIDYKLVEIMQKIRDMVDVPLIIRSNPADRSQHAGNRCLESNRLIGSEDTSQHVIGKAVDFHFDGFDGELPQAENKFYRHIANQIDERLMHGFGGIGVYCIKPGRKRCFLHIDVRNKVARWIDE